MTRRRARTVDSGALHGVRELQRATTAAWAPTSSPRAFALAPNAPNPFNPSTEIRFSLPEAGEAVLRVHDIAGRVVATLVNGVLGRGEHVVSFDGSALSTGVYFYTLEAAGQTTTRKMLLAK
jgi:hypothetical protein